VTPRQPEVYLGRPLRSPTKIYGRVLAPGLAELDPRLPQDLAHHLVERWFAELTAKKLRRGTHTSVRQLNNDIRAWIVTWNDNPRPYVWTKTADQILASIANYCTRINDSGHQ
jgi:hypothetical protein